MKAVPRVAASDSVIAATKAMESVAGMLAQAKFLACKRFATELLRFNVGMTEFGVLSSLLRKRNNEVRAAGTIRLEFVNPEGTIHPVAFSANECFISDHDMENFEYYCDWPNGSQTCGI